MTLFAVAEACCRIVSRGEVRAAWAAVRPHDVRITHALATLRAALGGRVDDDTLAALSHRLGQAADDVRRWADSDRWVCERAVAAIHAVHAAIQVLRRARQGDQIGVEIQARRTCRMVAEAAIEPVDDIRADLDNLVARARAQMEQQP